MLTENSVMLFDRIEDIDRGTVRTNAHFALLCLGGRAACRIGDTSYEIGRGDLFICAPNNFIESSMASLDFRYRCLVFAPEYFEDIFSLGGSSWEIHTYLEHHPTLHLGENEVRRFCDNYDFLKSKLTPPLPPHHKEMMRQLLHAMMYEFCDIFLPKLLSAAPSYTPAEHIFKRFVHLLEENTPLHRDVSWYADRLCVSPKHLSAVSKRCSGEAASALIRSFTLKCLKRLLRDPSKSIKEVSCEAGFDNISFFGKYVKRELGMSPRQYRLNGAK